MTKHFANTGFRVGYIENPKENYSTALSSTAVSEAFSTYEAMLELELEKGPRKCVFHVKQNSA